MKTFAKSLQLLKQNLRSVIGFALSYRLICMAILLPLLSGLFSLSLHLAGYEYLSEDRLFSYLLAPSTILILFFILFALSVMTAFEVFCYIPAYHASFFKQDITLTSMYRHGFSTLKKSFSPQNLPLFLQTLILIPLTNISVLSGYISSYVIPDFILYYISSKKIVFYVICILFFGLLLYSVRYCLIMQCFCLENTDYPKAFQKARQLTKKHFFSTLTNLLFWNIVLLLVMFLLILGCFFITASVLRIFFASEFNHTTLFFCFTIILTLLFDCYIFFSIPTSFSVLNSIYYRQMVREHFPIPMYEQPFVTLFGFITRRLFLFLVLLACGFHIFFVKQLSDSNFFWNQNIFSRPSITAHRGNSMVMPENTIAAFASAIACGADVIELDVQYTLDREIIVFHDDSLRRLCKNNAEIKTLNYDTLLKYDIAQNFSLPNTDSIDPGIWEPYESYGIDAYQAYHTIPTLEQVLAFSKGKVDLNIEIKEGKQNRGIEKEIVSLLEEYDYLDHCVIVSKDASCLKHIKTIHEKAKTIYLLPIAYGKYSNLDYIDGVSIKSSFLTRKLVNDIHDNEKEIYAWTVNQEDEMDRMYALGIDSLITDYPSKAKDLYFARTLNPSIYTWLKQLAHAWQ